MVPYSSTILNLCPLLKIITHKHHNTVKNRWFSCTHNISVERHVSSQLRSLGIHLKNSSARNTADWTHSQVREHKMQVWNENGEVENTNRRFLLCFVNKLSIWIFPNIDPKFLFPRSVFSLSLFKNGLRCMTQECAQKSTNYPPVTQLIAAVLNAHFTVNVLTNLKCTYSTQMRVTGNPYHEFRHIIAVLITRVRKSIVFLLILS